MLTYLTLDPRRMREGSAAGAVAVGRGSYRCWQPPSGPIHPSGATTSRRYLCSLSCGLALNEVPV